MTTEIEALQNAATELNLVIYEQYTQDKRKKVKMYFANMGNETVSPTLPYNELNMFLLGWIASKRHSSIAPKSDKEFSYEDERNWEWMHNKD